MVNSNIKVETASKDQLRDIKKLYLSAFPKAERKPFFLILKKAREGIMEVMALSSDGKFAGLAITVKFKDMVLLDYFATVPELRGTGIGSAALKYIREMYSKERFFLEIELPDQNNEDIKSRRKNFYLRGGLCETGIKVLLFGVKMEILSDGKPISYEDYHSLYRKSIGTFFARNVSELK